MHVYSRTDTHVYAYTHITDGHVGSMPKKFAILKSTVGLKASILRKGTCHVSMCIWRFVCLLWDDCVICMQGKARKGVGLLLVRLQQYAKGTDLAVPADFPDLQEVASART